MYIGAQIKVQGREKMIQSGLKSQQLNTMKQDRDLRYLRMYAQEWAIIDQKKGIVVLKKKQTKPVNI